MNHWLTLNLAGHTSNRDAIGAEIKIVTTVGSQWATVTTASSYLSSSDKRVHFGLGAEKTALTIEVHWPSGILQTLKNIQSDQILRIDEPDPIELWKIEPGTRNPEPCPMMTKD